MLRWSTNMDHKIKLYVIFTFWICENTRSIIFLINGFLLLYFLICWSCVNIQLLIFILVITCKNWREYTLYPAWQRTIGGSTHCILPGNVLLEGVHIVSCLATYYWREYTLYPAWQRTIGGSTYCILPGNVLLEGVHIVSCLVTYYWREYILYPAWQRTIACYGVTKQTRTTRHTHPQRFLQVRASTQTYQNSQRQ